MILQHYQIFSSQNFLNLSIPRNTQIATQKRRRHKATRCELANKKDVQLQTHTSQTAATNYQQTTWSHDFIQGLETNFSIMMNYKEKVKELEEKVRAMIMDYENGGYIMSTLKLLELIDDIQRLGLGYRFHTDITRVLSIIAVVNEMSLFELEKEEDNLYALFLRFRLLRQHGFSVSQDFVKRSFRNNHGGLKKNIKALLSIYEASFVALEGEKDLQEAKLFATENLLKIINGDKNDGVIDQVYHALDIPLYRRMDRLETRWFIDSYCKQKDANQLLLDLAILDFNMVQLTHKRDLQQVSKWWEKMGLARKLSFARDRVMECFFVSIAAVSEPQYSSCRVGLTKACLLITALDDIYDVYGSLDELQILTNAVKRWDINDIKYMPEYLQVGFLALYNTINELGYDTLLSQGENNIPILAKVWGEMFEAFFVEAEWSKSKYMPTFEEYLDNAWRSISQVLVLTHAYCLMNEDVKKLDEIELLDKLQDLFKWSSIISRLCNDLATSSDEMLRGKNVNAISCYMHEHGVCEEVAREYIKTLREKTWKKMIEARLNCSKKSMDPFIDMAINLTRFSCCMYQYGDVIGAPKAKIKDQILSIIVEPVS